MLQNLTLLNRECNSLPSSTKGISVTHTKNVFFVQLKIKQAFEEKIHAFCLLVELFS